MLKLLRILFMLISVAGMIHAIDTSRKHNGDPNEPQDSSTFAGVAPYFSARWCAASKTASDKALQDALDWACGPGKVDCSAIQPGGHCYEPNNLRSHASYAFNNYYQNNPIPSSCVFDGAATTTTVDPSTPMCNYPSSSGCAPPGTPTFWVLLLTGLIYIAARIA